MSVLYQDLTDEELATKIVTMTAKYEEALSGGVATVVAAEGRRIEYSRANANGLLSLITAARREQQRRAGVQVSGALTDSFPYAGDRYYG